MSYICFLYDLQIAIEIVAIKSYDNPGTKGLDNLLKNICALSIVSGLQLEALKCILKMIVNIALPNNQENKLCLDYLIDIGVYALSLFSYILGEHSLFKDVCINTLVKFIESCKQKLRKIKNKSLLITSYFFQRYFSNTVGSH